LKSAAIKPSLENGDRIDAYREARQLIGAGRAGGGLAAEPVAEDTATIRAP